MNMKIWLMPILLLLISGQTNSLEVLDGTNPKYIASVESLARSVQLMNKLENELMQVYNLNSLPGYTVSKELHLISEIKARANFILRPEKRRLLTKPLIIEGHYSTNKLNDLSKTKEN